MSKQKVEVFQLEGAASVKVLRLERVWPLQNTNFRSEYLKEGN